MAMGTTYLGPVLAFNKDASIVAALIAFGTSTAVLFTAGSIGYTIEETMNNGIPNFGKAMTNGGFVALESIVKFGVGGVIGNIGHVGENGPKFSKEWVGKNIFKLEFSQPIKSFRWNFYKQK